MKEAPRTATTQTHGSVEATPPQPADSPAVALVKRFYEAYGAEHLEGMRAVLVPDVVWLIPGRNSVSGDHHGIDETMYFFTQLTKAQFKADVHALVGNDEYAIDSHRGWGSYGGHSLDIEWVIVWRVREGKIVEGTDFAFDQEDADI